MVDHGCTDGGLIANRWGDPDKAGASIEKHRYRPTQTLAEHGLNSIATMEILEECAHLAYTHQIWLLRQRPTP